MADLTRDTQVQRVDPGRYATALSPDWAAPTPMGGFLAGVALRAAAAESTMPRPASFACQFLRVGRFDAPVEIVVTTLRRTRRAEALRVELRQGGEAVLSAQVWMVAEGLEGLAHCGATMPEVDPPAEVVGFEELAPNYDDWAPFWRNVRGRPFRWERPPEAAEPVCNIWMKLVDTPELESHLDDAVRQLLWSDMGPWNAVVSGHGHPVRYQAPNLDLTLQFHRFAPEAEWVLCHGVSVHGGDGLAGAVCELWTEDARLLASGTAQLLCRPNPMYPEQLAAHQRHQALRRGSRG